MTDLESMQRYIKEKEEGPLEKRTFRNEPRTITVKYNNFSINSIICETPNEYAILQNKIQ
jgi:hypothetical protein